METNAAVSNETATMSPDMSQAKPQAQTQTPPKKEEKKITAYVGKGISVAGRLVEGAGFYTLAAGFGLYLFVTLGPWVALAGLVGGYLISRAGGYLAAYAENRPYAFFGGLFSAAKA